MANTSTYMTCGWIYQVSVAQQLPGTFILISVNDSVLRFQSLFFVAYITVLLCSLFSNSALKAASVLNRISCQSSAPKVKRAPALQCCLHTYWHDQQPLSGCMLGGNCCRLTTTATATDTATTNTTTPIQWLLFQDSLGKSVTER